MANVRRLAAGADRRMCRSIAVVALGLVLPLGSLAADPPSPAADPAAGHAASDLERLARPPGGTETEPSELAALKLLANARLERSEGRMDHARRALELLIARYPDSASAAPARRELYALYATDPEIAAAAPASPRTPNDPRPGPGASPVETVAPASPSAAPPVPAGAPAS